MTFDKSKDYELTILILFDDRNTFNWVLSGQLHYAIDNLFIDKNFSKREDETKSNVILQLTRLIYIVHIGWDWAMNVYNL